MRFNTSVLLLVIISLHWRLKMHPLLWARINQSTNKFKWEYHTDGFAWHHLCARNRYSVFRHFHVDSSHIMHKDTSKWHCSHVMNQISYPELCWHPGENQQKLANTSQPIAVRNSNSMSIALRLGIPFHPRQSFMHLYKIFRIWQLIGKSSLHTKPIENRFRNNFNTFGESHSMKSLNVAKDASKWLLFVQMANTRGETRFSSNQKWFQIQDAISWVFERDFSNVYLHIVLSVSVSHSNCAVHAWVSFNEIYLQ